MHDFKWDSTHNIDAQYWAHNGNRKTAHYYKCSKCGVLTYSSHTEQLPPEDILKMNESCGNCTSI